MDLDSLVELAPHYAAMLLLVFLAIAVVRLLFGDLGFWLELAVVVVVAFLYRPLVEALDLAPGVWQE